jgi:hypothetical protein
MVEFQTLREGRIQFKIGAEERRLLNELVLQERERPGPHRSRATIADVLIQLIQAWCRKPRRFKGVRIGGEPQRVDCRMRFPRDRVCQQFADLLKVRGEKSASAVLRAIVREHIELRRSELKAAPAAREAAAAERERRERKAAKQRRYRALVRTGFLADAVELFLIELGDRYTGRAVERLDRDAAALAKLGLRVADYFAAVMNAKERRNPRAADEKREFAEAFVFRLNYALAKPSEMVSLSERGSTAHGWQSPARPSGS